MRIRKELAPGWQLIMDNAIEEIDSRISALESKSKGPLPGKSRLA